MKINSDKHFEYIISTLPKNDFPLSTPLNPRNSYALLTTNECIDANFKAKKGAGIDGYIIGVGFGNIFKMLDLFMAGSTPKAIISLDVRPEVVLMGRIIVEKLASSKDVDNFLQSLHMLDKKEITSILRQEKNKKLKKILKQASQYITFVFNNTHSLIKKNAYLSPSIADVLVRHYGVLKKLAVSNNIGVIFMDITNESFQQFILKLKHYKKLRSIIYLSNAIDHITNRGLDVHLFSALEKLKEIQTIRKNIFVDTNMFLHYKLRVKASPPRYSQKDYPLFTN